MPKVLSGAVDEYPASLPPDERATLQRLRRQIRTAAAGAEECISYGIPAFRLHGRLLVHFGASAKDCAFYPGAVVQSYRREPKGYDVGKGTVRFQADAPLPAALVRKLVHAQLAKRLAPKQSTRAAGVWRRKP